MESVGTLTQGKKVLYLYPDGTMIPMVAGGDWLDDYGLKPERSTSGASKTYGGGYRVVDSWEDLNSAVDDWKLKSLVEILRDLSLNGSMISDRFYKSLQNSLLITEAAGIGSVAELSQTPQIGDFLQRLQKAGNSIQDAVNLSPDSAATRNYAAEQASQNAFAAAEAEKDRAFRAQQAEMDREIERQNLIRQERATRIGALTDMLSQLHNIQPDLARFGAAMNSVRLQGVTPTVGYENALEGNIGTLRGQIDNPPPLGTPIPQVAPQGMAGTGMAMGGTIMPSQATMNIGTTKRGVLVGDREINGDEELLTMDPRTGEVEVIPIVGRAAEGATFNFSDLGLTTPKWDTTSLYGALSPLYQPFNITSAGMVPNKATAQPTDFGYIQPKFGGDFAPVQPPAYGPLSQQYFEQNTGMLLPNISTVLPQLRALYVNDPVGFANVVSFYENATDQQGNRSGLPREAIEAMLTNSALTGTSGTNLIGIR